MFIRHCKKYGHSAWARVYFNRGDVVHILKGTIEDKPSRHSIQVSMRKHCLDPIGIHINHSFNPSCEIEGKTVKALRDIKPGDQITFDYTKNETTIASPFIDLDTGEWVGKKIRMPV